MSAPHFAREYFTLQTTFGVVRIFECALCDFASSDPAAPHWGEKEDSAPFYGDPIVHPETPRSITDVRTALQGAREQLHEAMHRSTEPDLRVVLHQRALLQEQIATLEWVLGVA